MSGISYESYNKQLNEAVRDLGLSVSWEVYCLESWNWRREVTMDEFLSIYDKIARGLNGRKLWIIMPLILTYFAKDIYNWDDPIWSGRLANMLPDFIIDQFIGRDTNSFWSEIVDEETGKSVGIHYHASFLWRTLVSSKGSVIRYHVVYDEEDANTVCCGRKFMVKKTDFEKACLARQEALKLVSDGRDH
jgi:hypothetical protein